VTIEHITFLQEKLDKTRSWHKVCISMGFDTNKSLPQVLRTYYMKILHPYHVFCKVKLCKKEEAKVEDKDLEVLEEVTPKRTIEVIELSDDDDDDGDKAVKKAKTDNEKPADNEVQVQMVGNDYTPHGIESRYV